MTTTPLSYNYHKGKQQGSVYIFNKDDVLSDSDTEVYQMKTIRSRNKLKEEQPSVGEPHQTMSHAVLPSDTLQSLSLKYHCKVSDLKRINHIWNGNELSARDTLLIPVQKHSFLLDNPRGSHDQQQPIKSNLESENNKVDIRTISIKNLGDSVDTKKFLERMNNDIETLLRETREKTRKSSLSEVKTALTVERIFPKQVHSSRTGLSYCNIILISGLFCFVFIGLPALLVMYWESVITSVKSIGQ